MLCLTCHRVRPALSRTDYTAERAWLIVHRGLCACAATHRALNARADALGNARGDARGDAGRDAAGRQVRSPK
jgi:hypothetical protein